MSDESATPNHLKGWSTISDEELALLRAIKDEAMSYSNGSGEPKYLFYAVEAYEEWENGKS